MSRVLLAVVVLVAGVWVARVDWTGALPWGSACEVTDSSGEVLAAGSPDEVAEVVADADGEIGRALAAGPALTCRIAANPVKGEAKELPLGLTPQAQLLRDEVREAFGRVPDGGYGPQETLPGRRPGGEHSAGRAIDYFFRPYTDADQVAAGWRLANWLVANAERLEVRVVIYSDQIWSARRSALGWRDYRFRGPDPDNPINRHLDHVHVDVA